MDWTGAGAKVPVDYVRPICTVSEVKGPGPGRTEMEGSLTYPSTRPGTESEGGREREEGDPNGMSQRQGDRIRIGDDSGRVHPSSMKRGDGVGLMPDGFR